MADSERDKGPFKARVQLVGVEPGETPPALAVYQIDTTGVAVKKLSDVRDGHLEVRPEWEKLAGIALGPDVEDFKTLQTESLLPYRLETILPVWREQGIVVGRNVWKIFWRQHICVSGTVRKCRPWWWRRLEILELGASVRLTEPIASLATAGERPWMFPTFCLPLCDGIVEIYERVCCCRIVKVPDILQHLRDILYQVPIPFPHPPDPDPPPLAIDLGRLTAARAARPAFELSRARVTGVRRQTVELRARIAAADVDPLTSPSERLYDDYLALSDLRGAQAEEYVRERPYLLHINCSCRQRKVGEIPLQPGGRFDFCYWTRSPIIDVPWCHRTFAYRVRQRINQAWVVVYDGVASYDWFSDGTQADLRTWDQRALTCGAGPGDQPPSDGALPFVMLEYIGNPNTKHFGFPAQTSVSHLGALAANSGTYTTSYAPDCAWGGALALRLWVHPGMQPIATYYRLKVVPVDDSGAPSGDESILDTPVTWDRFVPVGSEWVPTPDLLSADPSTVGGQHGLIRIPYWSGGLYWLSGQYHQVWNTAHFAEGRYLLLLELFDSSGARIKPSAAPVTDPGTARPFELRRWHFNDTTATDNVPFADAAHAFWIDNTPVQGDIVDIRKNGVPSSDECQFLSGPATTGVSVGFRAFHRHGVSNPTDTFMASYSLTWTRGLNGPHGTFAAGTANVGETPPPPAPPTSPAVSTTLTSAFLLGPFPPHFPGHQRCTFAIQLHVAAKHFTGSSRIGSYDYFETASLALSIE